MSSRTCILVLVSGLIAACSGSSETTGPGPTGGSSGSDAAAGGAGGTGGSAGSGGVATGGAAGTGGVVTGGGAGTGGTLAGGAAGTGGTATGGSAGTGGAAGGAQAAAECTDASQCTLWSDCCYCLPLGPGESAPTCSQPECYVGACTGEAIVGVTCEAGQCVFDVDCDESTVLCNGMPPSCKAGEVPSVKDECWTGKCVKASRCSKVTSCAKCDPATTTCVVDVTQMGPRTHCVEVPDVCKGQTNCACLGKAVCMPPYGTCSDSNPPGSTISCDCPTC